MIPTAQLERTFRETLDTQTWVNQQAEHAHKVEALIGEYLIKRSQHVKNPVMDFLFEYYAFRPSMLRRWSPGIGIALTLDDTSQSKLPELSELSVDGDFAYLNADLFPQKRIKSLRWILQMLQNTAAKRPSFGCFGMHEWAMVYKSEKPRHDQVPLRMEPDMIAKFVESRPLLCTHFDAFRFFTKPAQPMNRFDLSRENFAETEQPGCIHSNMDLYKWAFKLYPWVSSDIILQAFELAYEARLVDMKASPYDLRDQGLDPILIETEEGRIEYKETQEAIFEKGSPIREALIHEYEYVLSVIS